MSIAYKLVSPLTLYLGICGDRVNVNITGWQCPLCGNTFCGGSSNKLWIPLRIDSWKKVDPTKHCPSISEKCAEVGNLNLIDEFLFREREKCCYPCYDKIKEFGFPLLNRIDHNQNRGY